MVAAERQRGEELSDLRESRRLATLMAFAITAAQRGQDDALEHFDRLHGDPLLRAAAAGKRERLRDGEAIDDAGRTLARVCSILLDDTIAEPLRDVVFAAVERDRITAAVTAIGCLTRSPDDRARELVTRSYRECGGTCRCCLTRSSSARPTLASRSSKRSPRCSSAKAAAS